LEEDVRGSIAPGKLADLVVLSQDVFRASPEAIPKTKSWPRCSVARVVYRDAR
jgi:predicted amidohydrolase YtcJ